MTNTATLVPDEIFGHRTAGLDWTHLPGSSRFDYPIDYSIALLQADPATQTVEFLTLWAPDAYCHFHQHLGPTRSVVIGGELHVYETDIHLDVHKTRRTGHESANDGGDIHMEQAGPGGALVYYAMQARDGRLFDILTRDRQVLRTLSFEDFAEGRI